MKIIITERQQKLISEDEDRDFLVMKKTAKKYLNKKYGDLTPVTNKKYKDMVFYVDNDRNVYFDYDKKENISYVDFNTIWNLLRQDMGFSYQQTIQVIKEWLEENYNLTITRALSLIGTDERSWVKIKNSI